MTGSAATAVRAALLLLMLSTGGFAQAHESRPLYIEIRERGSELVEVRWRAPQSLRSVNVPEIALPSSCAPIGAVRRIDEPGAYVQLQLHRCPEGLSGGEIEIRFPMLNPSLSSLLRFERATGEVHTSRLGPGEIRWQVPERETRGGVARQYAALGIEHILGGYDHLLFLVCLLLIARTWRKILITVTGFTLAHSFTLALAALGVVRVSIAPVEATIAFSIVFVAREIARPARDTLTYRYPVAVSASFGLLHGFGFAAVLHEIGLPQNEIPLALLFFNLGVEIGQLLFVGGLICLGILARVLARAAGEGIGGSLAGGSKLERFAAYAVGSLAAYWVIQRVSSFWA